MNLFFVVSFFFKGKGRAILRAKLDAIKGIPSVLRRRKETQKMRVASVGALHRLMSKGILDPYWASRQRKREGRR